MQLGAIVLTAWIDKGKVVVDSNGNVILCDTCPCSCCPGGPTFNQLYWYGVFGDSSVFSSPPTFPTGLGCMSPFCTDTAGVNLFSSYFEHGSGSIHYGFLVGATNIDPDTGLPDPFGALFDVQTGMIGCINVRFISKCLDSVYSVKVEEDIGDGHGWSFSNSFLDGCGIPTFGCKNFTSSGTGFGYWISSSPIDSIPVPDGASTIVPLTLDFAITLTKSGVPTMYTAALQFSPNIGFTTGATCWTWSGFFTNCVGNCSYVTLSFNDVSGLWEIDIVGSTGGNIVPVYSGGTYPTSGVVTPTSSAACQDEVASPWSLS